MFQGSNVDFHLSLEFEIESLHNDISFWLCVYGICCLHKLLRLFSLNMSLVDMDSWKCTYFFQFVTSDHVFFQNDGILVCINIDIYIHVCLFVFCFLQM